MHSITVEMLADHGQFRKGQFVSAKSADEHTALSSLVQRGFAKALHFSTKAADMNTEQGSRGGFAKQDTTEPTVLQRGFRNPFYAHAINLPPTPHSSGKHSIPVFDHKSAVAARESNLAGELQVQIRAQGTAVTKTAPTFAQVNMFARDMEAAVDVPNQWSPPAQASVENGLINAFHWKCLYWFLQGIGVSEPIGLANSDLARTVTRAGSTAIAAADVRDMLELFLPPLDSRTAFWFTSPTCLDQIFTNFAPTNVVIDGRPAIMLAGYELIVTDACPVLGARGDLMLADLQSYAIYWHQYPQVLKSPHEPTAFMKHATCFRIHGIMDAKPWMPAPMELNDGTTTVSPIVVLV